MHTFLISKYTFKLELDIATQLNHFCFGVFLVTRIFW